MEKDKGSQPANSGKLHILGRSCTPLYMVWESEKENVWKRQVMDKDTGWWTLYRKSKRIIVIS